MVIYRPFLPPMRVNEAQNRHRIARECALKARGGDPVIHICHAGQEVVALWFHDAPLSLDMGDMAMTQTDPLLRGSLEWFQFPPQIFKPPRQQGGDPRGSQFIVGGVLYDAKDVEPDHTNGVTIKLSKAQNCEIKDFNFIESVRPYLCLHGIE